MKNTFLSLLLVSTLAGCGSKKDDPSASYSVPDLKVSRWRGSAYTQFTVSAGGVRGSATYVPGTIGLQFSEDNTWVLARAGDSYGSGFTRQGGYTYSGSVLDMTGSNQIRVLTLSKNALLFTEVFPAATGPNTNGSHVENDYDLSR